MRKEEEGSRETFDTVVNDIKRFLKFRPEDTEKQVDVKFINMLVNKESWEDKLRAMTKA